MRRSGFEVLVRPFLSIRLDGDFTVGYLPLVTPSPELHQANVPRLKRSWQVRITSWDWQTISLILGIKALLLIFAVQSISTREILTRGWLEIWNQWDAMHYLRLAEKGYSATGEERVSLAFFPFYPWLVRAANLAARNVHLAAFIVSGAASVAAGLLLQRLARLDESRAVARNAVWFLFIFPTSFFLHIGYTESTFLALTLGCFFAARTNRWALAGLLGACAGLTRLNGLMLVPALAVEAFLQYRATRRSNWGWLWIGAVGLGFLGYLWLNHAVAGDPFAFTSIQSEHWFKKLTPPWVGIREVYLRTTGGNAIEGLHELFFIGLLFVFLIWSARRQRLSYATWIACNLALMTSTTFIISVPRYALTLFPIFILMAQSCTQRVLWLGIVSVGSILFLGLYMGRFVAGYWAF
ncbi:MAG: hypothetical protein M3Q89_07340 [Verrucomicrobiota bacterium]|nr:hypothetical protein [Verrucomicrobiota bacterium]